MVNFSSEAKVSEHIPTLAYAPASHENQQFSGFRNAVQHGVQFSVTLCAFAARSVHGAVLADAGLLHFMPNGRLEHVQRTPKFSASRQKDIEVGRARA